MGKVGKATGRRGFGEAIGDLAAAQKNPAGVPAYTRFVNRPLGRVCAAAAYVLRLTPNQVTLLSAAVSFAAIAAIVVAEPSWQLGLLVAFGLAAGYVLDSADGQLARLRGGGSPAGEWLDHVVDAARLPALHLAFLIALVRFEPQLYLGYLAIPAGYLVVSVVRFFAQILAEQMKRRHAVPERSFAGDSPAKSLMLLPLDYGVLCLVPVLWGSTTAFLLVYGALFAANAALLGLTLLRRYRELATA